MTTEHDSSGRWVVHGEHPIYESEWVTVGVADISQPSGDRFEHHTVTLPPAARSLTRFSGHVGLGDHAAVAAVL